MDEVMDLAVDNLGRIMQVRLVLAGNHLMPGAADPIWLPRRGDTVL